MCGPGPPKDRSHCSHRCRWYSLNIIVQIKKAYQGQPKQIAAAPNRSWKFERRPEWGNERFPPTVRSAPEDEARVRARWEEYGLGDL